MASFPSVRFNFLLKVWDQGVCLRAEIEVKKPEGYLVVGLLIFCSKIALAKYA